MSDLMSGLGPAARTSRGEGLSGVRPRPTVPIARPRPGTLDPDLLTSIIGSLTQPRDDSLAPNETLPVDEPLLSAGGFVKLVFQSDGNLVLYCARPWGWIARWSSETWGQPVDRCIMQDDGNLVLYNGAAPVWATNTWTKAFGVHTRLGYTWDVVSALPGGSRVTLLWKRDRC